jgi:hypothetical protein
MKKLLLSLFLFLMTASASAGDILIEGFEYGNHDLEQPVGWLSDDNAWLSGYLEKDHNRIPHTGNWYAFSNADDSWMFMQLYLISGMQYRINCWAISDGSCQLEIWTGSSPAAADMHTLLFSTTVGSDGYQKLSNYVETIPSGCNYIAIHALTNGAATCLTIDDIEIDMVEQYQFEAEPITGDSAMYPGTQGSFRYLVHNIGFDALDITMNPSNEFFTGFTCSANGTTGMTFHAEPDEILEVTITATLRPEIEPGTICWLDVNMTIPCNCNTAMVTFWVTPLDVEQTTENDAPEVSVYPNPTADIVTIELEGLQQVDVFDATGRKIKSVPAVGNALQLDLTGLKAGVYFISAKTCSTSSFVKSILKM